MGAGVIDARFSHAMHTARESYAAVLTPFLSRRLLTAAQVETVLAGFEDGFRAGYQAAELDARTNAQHAAPIVERAPSDGEE